MAEPVAFDSWAVGELDRLNALVTILLEDRRIDYEPVDRPAVESIESVVHRAITATRTNKTIRRDEHGEIVEIIETREVGP